jgi:hypothetical protein
MTLELFPSSSGNCFTASKHPPSASAPLGFMLWNLSPTSNWILDRPCERIMNLHHLAAAEEYDHDQLLSLK